MLLVGPTDHDIPEQVRIGLVPCCRTTQVRFWVQGFDAHPPHQPLHAFSADRLSVLPSQQHGEFAASEVGQLQVKFVQPPHEAQIVPALAGRLMVESRARQPEQLALPCQR
jgi:hypothetical protein